MFQLALALTLTASPSGAKATSLAEAKEWDALFAAFANAKVDGYGAKERVQIAGALSSGCEGILAEDATMASQLGELSIGFQPTVENCTCAAVAGRRAKLHELAENALKVGLSKFPKDESLKLEHVRLMTDEGDRVMAEKTYAEMKKNSPQAKEAFALLFGAAAEKKPAPSVATAGSKSPRDNAFEGSGGSNTYQSTTDEEGRRIRFNAHFRFRYFNGKRDFGQRAEYEGKIQAAMELARQSAGRILGVNREAPLDVILYSRQEFAMHHGEQMAQQVAGFYSENSIRMNDTAEVNERNQAVLVHEFVHAVVDDLTESRSRRVPFWVNEGLAEYTKWKFEGQDGPALNYRRRLKDLAAQQRLPRLDQMTTEAPIKQGDPGAAYAFSGESVRIMVSKSGVSQVIEYIRKCGQGQDAQVTFRQFFGKDFEEFQHEMESELK